MKVRRWTFELCKYFMCSKVIEEQWKKKIVELNVNINTGT